MALRFLEGFGGYAAGTKTFGSNDELLLQFTSWNEAPDITEIENVTAGRRAYVDGASVSINDIQMDVQTQTALNDDTLVFGCRFYWEPDGSYQMLFQLNNNGGFQIGCIGISQSGTIFYTTNNQGQPGGQLHSTARLKAKSWNYVEVKVVLDATTGAVDFHLNGQAVGSFTSQDTENSAGPCTQVWIGNALFSLDWHYLSRITDVYIDTATVHGPMAIYYQPCDSAGSSAGFTPAASTNQSQVDEIGADGDTTYNESTAAVSLDQLGHSDSVSVAPIALQPMVMARYVPTGSSNIQVGVLSGATHDQDAEVGITDSYAGYQGKVYETDPNTASAWTSTNANNAETSYEHSS